MMEKKVFTLIKAKRKLARGAQLSKSINPAGLERLPYAFAFA